MKKRFYLAAALAAALAATLLPAGCADDDNNNGGTEGFLFEIPDEYPPSSERYADDDDDDSTIPPEEGDYEVEPNNTFQSATDLGTLINNLNTAGSINAADDIDLYRFTVGQNERVKIILRWATSDALLTMQLFDQSNNLLFSTLGDSSPATIDLSLTKSEYYYINITSLYGSSNYTISISSRVDDRPRTVLEDEITEDLVAEAYQLGGEDEIVDQITELVQVGDQVVYNDATYSVRGVTITRFPPPALLFNEGVISGTTYNLFVPFDLEADPQRESNYVVVISLSGD